MVLTASVLSFVTIIDNGMKIGNKAKNMKLAIQLTIFNLLHELAIRRNIQDLDNFL